MTPIEALNGMVQVLVNTPGLPVTFMQVKKLELTIREALEKEVPNDTKESTTSNIVGLHPEEPGVLEE